ncbi:UDP-N-acetylglucosamine 2-epimerase [Tepidibacillus sp. HK-1]|uniref:UDP-N-acetylglucosamine 2-epimerase n=1 Tax=Tepidibacillus sp. HK-1 TaxID=1883407 RepID=UPI000852B047|nr:UDP-N-acetylglucosamine 2-epimerase [Tepidibacillus sp. HK-1]GBF10546.1 GDP/UDP-N,N'-diacetylbacillosamine 2-epimerase [Tepidibacillus sp. HK-1]
MVKRKICVVTGSRAEYGLLYWLMKEIQQDEEMNLQIIVTGMHLSPEFGLTYKIIEEDGFNVDEKVEMLLSSDTSVGIAKSIGLGIIGFADALERLKPDLMVLLGDRYEILAAAQAAMVAKIPIAHIAGGDTTEGAYDEAIRHSITKMSHLHFVTNEEAAKRVRQLGENPKHIYNVGSPGLDQINRLKLLSRSEVERSLDFKLKDKNLLITFHPVTLDDQPALRQFHELLDALDSLGADVGLIFTKPNADSDGRILIKMIDDFILSHPNAKAYNSLGQLRYLSTISHVDAVVGNSSSGLYEVPSFKKPTVNIGDRQKGRLQASSVINTEPIKEEILKTIHLAFHLDCSNVINPYGDGSSSNRIVKHLKEIRDYKLLLKKHFFEVNVK